MPDSHPGSLVSLGMSVAYLLAGGLCALNARRCPKPGHRARLSRHWHAIALTMLALAIWRVSHWEGWLTQSLRLLSQNGQMYDDRRLVQVPVLYLALGGLYLVFRRYGGGLRKERSKLALMATLALVALTFLRTVSLHFTDALLYASVGPLHLHHLLDIALTMTVIACGLLALIE